jgi:membrane protein DedA with SNARE-associated domain
MLPVCIAGVIVGDFFLYGIGRQWGPRMLQWNWVKTKLLPPERLVSIERNFQQYGVRILLFARLTPGIRAPIFFTAGLTQLPLSRFLLADGIYAIPGVSLLFLLGYWFTEGMKNLLEDVEHVKSIIVIVLIAAVVLYILYKVFRKPVVTGNPHEMPKAVEAVTHGIEQGIEKVTHGLETLTGKIILPHKGTNPEGQAPPASAVHPPADGQTPRTEGQQPAPTAPERGAPPHP